MERSKNKFSDNIPMELRNMPGNKPIENTVRKLIALPNLCRNRKNINTRDNNKNILTVR